jgi:hypothetical protein
VTTDSGAKRAPVKSGAKADTKAGAAVNTPAASTSVDTKASVETKKGDKKAK